MKKLIWYMLIIESEVYLILFLNDLIHNIIITASICLIYGCLLVYFCYSVHKNQKVQNALLLKSLKIVTDENLHITIENDTIHFSQEYIVALAVLNKQLADTLKNSF